MTVGRSSRTLVLPQTLAAGMFYVVAIVAVDRWWFAPSIASRQLSIAMSIALVQCTTIIALLAFSFWAKFLGQLRATRAARVMPRIRDLLALHAAGASQIAGIGRAAVAYPMETERCVVELLRIVRGSGREALSQIAANLRLVEKWQRESRSRNITRRKAAIASLALIERKFTGGVLQAALADPEERVRLCAARAILSNVEPDELEPVFRLAVEGSFETRLVLAEDLRPHALDLARHAIPIILASGEKTRIVAVLEILRAWGKLLPLPELEGLLRNPDPAIRTSALDLLPLCLRSFDGVDAAVLGGLSDPVEKVRAAAARSAALVGAASALPALARCLREDQSASAAAAAQALAQFGADGCRILEQEILSGRPEASSLALEALERIRTSAPETVVA